MIKKTLWVLFGLFFHLSAYSYTWFVDVNNGSPCGSVNGSSWSQSLNDLQCAINYASNGDIIYVAAGTYVPNMDVNLNTAPADINTLTFSVNKNLSIYGGFAYGDPGNPAARTLPLTTNQTILTGFLGGSNYSYHVVTRTNQSSGSLTMDGITIQKGQASGAATNEDRGAAFFASSMYSPVDQIYLENVIVRNNSSATAGAVYAGYHIDLHMLNSTLSYNTTGTYGGALYATPNSDVLLQSCKVENNSAVTGGGIAFAGMLTLSDCEFKSNTASLSGGAIVTLAAATGFSALNVDFINNSATNPSLNTRGGAIWIGGSNYLNTPTLSSCYFEDNTANDGGAIHQDGVWGDEVDYKKCTFFANTATGVAARGGAIHGVAGQVYNCIFHANHSDKNGGAVYTENQYEMDFVNCTFTKNSANNQGGAHFEDNNAKTTYIYNCIYWDNTALYNNDIHDLSAEVEMSHSLTQEYGTHGVNGNLVANQSLADPLFVDINNPPGANGDWNDGDDGLMLFNGSDAQSSGHVAIVNSKGIALDIKYTSRTTGSTVNMGAHEFANYATPTCFITGHIHVDYSATGSNTGECWDNAYTSLQTALDNASTGDVIWIAGGTYKPSHNLSGNVPSNMEDATFDMSIKNLSVYGGFAGTESTLSQRDLSITANTTYLSGNNGSSVQDKSHHVVYRKDADGLLTLDGLHIREGYADGNSSEGHGAALYVTTSLTTDEIRLTHLTLENNYSENGGAFWVGYAIEAIVKNSSFNDNISASIGAAITMTTHPNSSLTISDGSAFNNNQAATGGGAIASSATLNISDTKFEDNDADNTGGAIYTLITTEVFNIEDCQFINNTSATGGALTINSYDFTANPKIIRCDFEKNIAESRGGALYQGYDQTAPIHLIEIDDCIFFENEVTTPSGNGGAIYGGAGYIRNSAFYGNKSTHWGGALYTHTHGDTEITNCTFVKNTASVHGGAIFDDGNNHMITIQNSILWANDAVSGNGDDVYPENAFNTETSMAYSLSQLFGVDGVDNNHVGSSYDPDFYNINDAKGNGEWRDANDGLNITATSDARDEGNVYSGYPISFDLKLVDRVWNSLVDCGAYEYCTNCKLASPPPVTTSFLDELSDFIVYPNPNNGLFSLKMNGLAPDDKLNIEIFNVLGVKVYANEIANNSPIDLSNQAKGIYVIRIRKDNKSFTQQMVLK